MSLKHTWTTSIKNDAGAAVVSESEVVTGNQEDNFNDVAAASSTKHISVGSVVKANLQSFYVFSDKNVTLKINSSSTPDQTVSLIANRAYAWKTTDPGSNPLTPGTITDLYFVNAGGTDANIKGGFLANN